MKSLQQFINESSIDKKVRYQFEEELRDNNNEKINYNFLDSNKGWLLTFIGEPNQNDTDFMKICIDLLNKTKLWKSEKGNDTFGFYKKINKEKRPIIYIAEKDYLESIKKDLQN